MGVDGLEEGSYMEVYKALSARIEDHVTKELDWL